MQVETARRLDRWLGIPFCSILTAVRRGARALRGTRPLPSPKNILIIKLAELGNTILAYPALTELKRRCPDARLFFLVLRSNAEIIEVLGLAPASRVVSIDDGSLVRLVVSGIGAFRQLLRERIDTTIDLDFFSRLTAACAFMVCRGIRVGFHRYNEEGRYRGDLLTHRVMYSPHIHTAAAFMALIRTVFDKADDEPHYRGRIDAAALVVPPYTPPGEDVQVARDLIALEPVSGRAAPLILINPNSSEIFPLRRWPLASFAELCRRLLDAVPDCRLAITGLASESRDARFIADRVRDRRCIDVTGRTSFRQLLALYSLAALMVTNDSGPAHFASLLQLPTVVLFGPETPRLYAPLGTASTAVYAEFACSPCVSLYNAKKSPCTDNRCLSSISVDAVLAEALARLAPDGRFPVTGPQIASAALPVDAVLRDGRT
jgi:ADP-heptose:LPS heptosyltransferase